jgi:hypothetical protein
MVFNWDYNKIENIIINKKKSNIKDNAKVKLIKDKKEKIIIK